VNRVVVTGLGVITPIGNDKQTFWQSIIDGKSGADSITCFDATNFPTKIAAQVKNFDSSNCISQKEARRTERFIQFAVCASKMAVDDSGLAFENQDRDRIGVIIGSGIGGLPIMEEQTLVLYEKGPSRLSPFLIPMLIPDMAAGYVSIFFGVKGPNFCCVTACASGNHSIGEAYRMIQYGQADIMITGGTEACITPLGVGGFCALKALSTRNDQPQKASRPFDKQRDGFLMGEGAGIVILEEFEHAKKRGARIYAEMVGFGMSSDAYHITAPQPSGDGAVRCIDAALKDAKINTEDVSYINAHGTSTELNDKIETIAVKRVFGEYAHKIPMSSTKSMTGHLLGAAGGVEFVVSALSIFNSIIPPTINYEHPDPDCDLDYVPNISRKQDVRVVLSNSFGFGGHNASVVLRKI
jgi:3-oxoacyl-[acyl-carrier-protein] synthase II